MQVTLKEQRRNRLRNAALKALVAFISIMVLVTVTSNALQEMSVAVVVDAQPSRGTLQRSVSGTGTLEAGSEVAVWAEDALRVETVNVAVGQNVKAGDTLYTLNIASLEETLATQEDDLDKALNSRKKSALDSNAGQSDNTTMADAYRTLDRAEENRETTAQNQAIAIEQARADLEKAESDLQKAEAEYQNAQANSYADIVKQQQDDLYTAQQNLAAKQRAYESAQQGADTSTTSASRKIEDARIAVDRARQALSETERYDEEGNTNAAYDQAVQKYEDALLTLSRAEADYGSSESDGGRSLQSARDELDKAQKAIYDLQNAKPIEQQVEEAVAAKKTAVETAQGNVTAKQTALEKALRDQEESIKSADRSVEDAKASIDKQNEAARNKAASQAVSDRSRSLDLANQDIEIEAKRESIAALKEKIAAGGAITAPCDGTIMEVGASVGTTVATNQASVKIHAADAGLELHVKVTAEEAEYMAVGDEVTLTVAGETVRGNIMSMEVVSGSEDKEVVVPLPSGVGTNGQSVSMRFTKRTDTYNSIIPLSALREDQDGYFVYVIKQQEGALGARSTIERVDVTVTDRDATRAAISGGVTERDRIVVRSDRTLNDGDRVRLEG